MKLADGNPPENSLPAGVTDSALETSIKRSGYPLQSRVAALLQPHLTTLEEEWGYVDADSGELRTLDLYGWKQVGTDRELSSKRVRANISWLIECKQAELPYVFFQSLSASLRQFPKLIGLGRDELELETNNSRSTWTVPLQIALSLNRTTFGARTAAPTATSVSRVARKGKDLELSGSDAYLSTILPLVKACDYLSQMHVPKDTYRYFDLHAVLMVCVLDAPMVVVKLEGAGPELVLAPWVRLVRQQAKRSPEDAFDTASVYGIDFVHVAFLERFVIDHVAMFAGDFSARVYRHPSELVSGTGFIENLEGRALPVDAEAELRPRGVRMRRGRDARR